MATLMVMPLGARPQTTAPPSQAPEPRPGGWIAVDLDGTLAHYDHWHADGRIGDPVPEMATRVRQWLNDGRTVVIFTARLVDGGMESERAKWNIEQWCKRWFGQALLVTATKSPKMTEIWDDRAIRVETNTGRLI